MKILIDISHPAHVNFFKLAINKLDKSKNNIIITYLNRDKLPLIIGKELPNYFIKCVGAHKRTIFSIIFDANLKKFFNLLTFSLFNKNKIDLGISVGSFPLGFVLKILGKPNLQFGDDPEKKLNFLLMRLSSTELFFPPITNRKNNIKTMNALKEWAYLSPKYFLPKKEEIRRYNLQPKEYFFIREVSTGSMNYRKQQPNIIASFAHRLPKYYKVLLSLEDKTKAYKYPLDWILLEEPLNDIHSIMYYSKVVISSGDSMAREGAMLGVPSIYCGLRDMKANEIMINKGMMFKIEPHKVPDFISKILSGDIKTEKQDAYRQRLYHEWDDITEFIINQIKKYKKNKL
ncbi:MAG: DUF354 domain-containing protein [Candidatus Helarchaeota archaeon]